MRFLPIFLVGGIWAHGDGGGHDLQKEIIDAFLKQEDLGRIGPERAVEKNCNEDDLPSVPDRSLGVKFCNNTNFLCSGCAYFAHCAYSAHA